VIVLGNSNTSASPFVIGHGVMMDSIDSAAVIEALRSVGLGLGEISDPSSRGRLVNIFAKAEASPDGSVRGNRHTMLDDSDISATRHARAAVGGLISGLAGTSVVYVSGGAEHQGPPGEGPGAASSVIQWRCKSHRSCNLVWFHNIRYPKISRAGFGARSKAMEAASGSAQAKVRKAAGLSESLT
jgi:Amidohydrolase ring-opening protein (Amido_AtzD_TrzD)